MPTFLINVSCYCCCCYHHCHFTIRKTKLGTWDGGGGGKPPGSHRKEIVELGSNQGPDLSDMSEALIAGTEFQGHPKQLSHQDKLYFKAILKHFLK